MLEDLKLAKEYDGLLFLADATKGAPKLKSHHHIELELNLIIRGKITYVVGEKRYTFSPRTLLWLFPEQEHQLVDRTSDAKFYVASFKPSLIGRSCRTAAYDGLKQQRNRDDVVLNTVLEPSSFDLVRQTMDALMEDSLDADVLSRESGFGPGSDFSFQHGDPDGLNAGLHHLLLLCWRIHREGKIFDRAVALHPAVRRALNILSSKKWDGDLTDLASACLVSEAYLSRIFHRQLGVSLTRYRNSLRMSRFWEQYSQPEQKTLAEAVYGAGFGSYAQFYKLFVETYGVGPRECTAKWSQEKAEALTSA